MPKFNLDMKWLSLALPLSIIIAALIIHDAMTYRVRTCIEGQLEIARAMGEESSTVSLLSHGMALSQCGKN